MKPFKSIIVCIMFIGLCAACASKLSLDPALVPTAEYLVQNPLAKPAFLVGIHKGATIDGSAGYCAEIEQYQLGSETGAQVTIDGQPVADVEIWDGGSGHLGNGSIISAYRYFCFSIEHLSFGRHLGQIQFVTEADESDTYIWAFHVTQQDIERQPNELPTPALLPSLTPSSTPKR